MEGDGKEEKDKSETKLRILDQDSSYEPTLQEQESCSGDGQNQEFIENHSLGNDELEQNSSELGKNESKSAWSENEKRIPEKPNNDLGLVE